MKQACQLTMMDEQGYLPMARRLDSPNWDDRPVGEVDLIVIHHISLPPQIYTGNDIIALFTNTLDTRTHMAYTGLEGLKVSAHFLIRRKGELIQFVSCFKRAWHAGVSVWQGRERCNDFSLGIELEGSEYDAFEPEQYCVLRDLLAVLKTHFPIKDIVGHSDIAPERKRDPGPFFDWHELAAL